MPKHNDRVNSDVIEVYAQDNHVTLSYACAVFKSPLIANPDYWEQPASTDNLSKNEFARLVSPNSSDLLSRLTIAISDVIRFPKSTAFLHGMGAISSALNKGFSIKYHTGTIPLNLYVITAQRPSTGKSGINEFFFKPIHKAYKNESDSHAPKRAKIERELIIKEKDLEKETDDRLIQRYCDEIVDFKNELAKIPNWRCNLSDVTIEAAEGVAANQGGMFNIISAEADAINVVTGGVYGDGKAKKNLSLILSAWDGEHVSSARVGREGIDCEVRASIAVLAQADAVDTILAAGATGRGITERFLLLSEPSMLGSRGDLVYDKKTFQSLVSEYELMIANIVSESDIVIDFDKASESFLHSVIRRIEPKMADDGEYANDLVAGFMGKADKHIRKIAAVLHCSEEWRDGGSRSLLIKAPTIMRAVALFMELADRFLQTADSHGYSGEKSEIEKLIQYFTEKAEKGKIKITINSLRDNLKGSKPFKGTPNLTAKLRDKVLPILELNNYIVVADNIIYINPRLK